MRYLPAQKFSTRDISLNLKKTDENISDLGKYNRKTRVSKEPKLKSEIERLSLKNSSIHNYSSNLSIGGEIRESHPTKTMTRMKISFEGRGSNSNSEISQKFPTSQNSPNGVSIDSESIVVSFDV